MIGPAVHNQRTKVPFFGDRHSSRALSSSVDHMFEHGKHTMEIGIRLHVHLERFYSLERLLIIGAYYLAAEVWIVSQ